MSRELIYQGQFVNTETTRPDNENIQQVCVLNIYDNEFRLATDASRSSSNVVFDHSVFFWDTITVDFYIGFFYIGQVITISGSASNNITTTVAAILSSTSIGVSDTLVDETVSISTVIFTDNDPGSPVPEVQFLEMTDEPVIVSVIDNDEDKFTPVRSKQLEANVYTGNGIDIAAFGNGGDQRWYVEYLVNDILKFVGFLSISDLQQEFMPDPNVLVLTATDGLGFLSDIPLTDFEGENPQDENPIMDYIAWALSKTGLQLDIVVCMNIRERFATPLVSDDSGDGHFYKWISIDAKTFEKDIGESEDCRTVLEKILGECCTIYQDNGTWFIKRTDEFEYGHPDYLFRFDYQGVFIEKTEETFEKNIGVDLPLAWMNDDAQVLLERAFRLIKHIYKFLVPLEIIDNQNFDRGEVIASTPTVKTFTIEDWSRIIIDNTTGAESPETGFEAYIQKEYNEQGDITDQFVVIEPGTYVSGTRYAIKALPFPMHQNDKFNFSMDWRLDSDITSSSERTVYITLFILNGDDGSRWVYTQSTEIFPIQFFDLQWIPFDSVSFYHSIYYVYIPDNVDETKPINVSQEVKPLPVDGEITVYLFNYGQATGLGFHHDIKYSGLKIDYIPYINGSYKRYTGHENIVEQTINTVAVREEDVFIDTSPKKLFKGALLKADDDKFVLARLFYNAALDTSGAFADDNLIMSFGKLRAFDVWNQFNRLMRKFDGTVDGLESSTTIPDLKHRYFLTDVNINTVNKMFMLLHFEQDQHLCEWDSFFHEVADSTIDKIYTGHSFKYTDAG